MHPPPNLPLLLLLPPPSTLSCTTSCFPPPLHSPCFVSWWLSTCIGSTSSSRTRLKKKKDLGLGWSSLISELSMPEQQKARRRERIRTPSLILQQNMTSQYFLVLLVIFPLFLPQTGINTHEYVSEALHLAWFSCWSSNISPTCFRAQWG